MAWGARPGSRPIDDLLARLAGDDPSLPALALLPARAFGEAEAAALAGALAGNSRCRSLHLGGRPLGEAGAAALAAALGRRPPGASLEVLSVGDAAFGAGAGLAALAAGLADAVAGRSADGPPLVVTLDLEARGVGPPGAAALARAAAGREAGGGVGTARPFTSLALARNPGLGDGGAAALAGAIRRLTSLDVRGCGLGPAGARALADSLAELTQPPSLLRRLRAGGGDALGCACAEGLAAAAVRMGVQELHLTDVARAAGHVHHGPATTTPGDLAAAAASAALAACHEAQLATLDLSGSGVGDAGVLALSKAVRRATCPLRTLALGRAEKGDEEGGGQEEEEGARPRPRPYPPITDAGAAALGAALAAGSPLASLDLTRSGLSGAGAAALLPPGGGTALTSLCLAGSPLGDAGGAALAAALAAGGGRGLVVLDLAACALGDAGVGALADALAAAGGGGDTAAPALATLVLGGNPAAEGAGGGAAAAAARLRPARPGLDVAWTVGEGEQGGGGGRGGGGGGGTT